MDAATPYEGLVNELESQALADLDVGESRMQEVLDRMVDRLGTLVDAGQLTDDDVRSLNDRLNRSDTPRLYVADWLAELNIRAAQALGDWDLARTVAQTRAKALLAISAGQPDNRDGALGRLTRLGLDLSTQWDLVALAPKVVGGLHFHAARAGGTLEDVLNHQLEAFRLGEGQPAEVRDLLETSIRRIGEALANEARRRELAGLDHSKTKLMLLAALEAYREVGPEAAARKAELEILGFLLAHSDYLGARNLADGLDQEAFDADDRRRATLFQAELLVGEQRYEEALEVLDELLSSRSLPPRGRVIALACRADTYVKLGRFGDAESDLRRLLDRTRQMRRTPAYESDANGVVIDAERRLGTLRIRQGRSGAGNRVLRRAQREIEAWRMGPVTAFELANEWADALYDIEDWAGALEQYRRTASLRREVEQAMPDFRDVVASTEDAAITDERVIELLLRLDKPADAMEEAEGAKGRLLAALAHGRSLAGPPIVNADDSGLPESYALAAQELAEARTELDQMLPDAAGRWRVERRIQELTEQLPRMVELMTERAIQRTSEQASAIPPAPRRLALLSILELISPHIVGRGEEADSWGVVSIFTGSRGTSVVLESGMEFIGHWLGEWPHERLVRELFGPFESARAAFNEGRLNEEGWAAAVDSIRRDAHAVIWAPIAEEVARRKLKHLVVLPHRSLHALPWVGLEGEGGPLLDQVESLVLVPGANAVGTAVEHSRKGKPMWGPDDDVPGSFVMARADDRAPLIAAEAAMVASRLGRDARVSVGTNATPDALYSSAPSAGLLHIACHARWDPDSLAGSGLVLAPQKLPPLSPLGATRSVVSVPELLGRLVLPRCRLAVLSACETGSVLVTSGDEALGIPIAMIICGARRVVASHWRVRDDATLLLMSDFYSASNDSERAAVRLAQAQRTLRRTTAQEASEELQRIRVNLRQESLPPEERRRAEAAIGRHRKRLDALDPESRPFGSADYWASFDCYGAP